MKAGAACARCLGNGEARDDVEIVAMELSSLQVVVAAGSYHGGVVGTEVRRWNKDWQMGGVEETLSEDSVGCHAAAEQYLSCFELLGGADSLGHQDVDDGILEAGSGIGEQRGVGQQVLSLSEMPQGGLQTAEAEVVAVLEPGSWKGQAWRSGSRCFLDSRASGVAQIQDSGCLVKGFAGSIVASASQPVKLAMFLHQDQVAVSSGDDEAKAGENDLVVLA